MRHILKLDLTKWVWANGLYARIIFNFRNVLKIAFKNHKFKYLKQLIQVAVALVTPEVFEKHGRRYNWHPSRLAGMNISVRQSDVY